MIIEKIHIDSFGNLQNITLGLSDGVNIIEGANESGKSTVAAFIKFIFYGLSNKKGDKQLSERDRFINWNTGSAGGYLELKSDDEKYRIERTVIIAGQNVDGSESKKSYREGCQIIALSNNSVLSGYSSPGEYFLGVDEELFEKSAFVSQPGGTKIDGNKLLDSIENILFSASENINITKALKKLDASRVALLHKNGGGGQIFELETKCAQLEAKLESAKSIAGDILNNENSLREAKKNLESALLKKDKLNKVITAFENSTVITLFDKLHSIEAQAAEAEDVISSLKAKYTVDGLYPDDEYISKLEALCEKLRALKEEVYKKEAELNEVKNSFDNIGDGTAASYDKVPDILSRLDSCKQKKHTSAVLSWAFGIFTLLFALGGALSIYLNYFSEIGIILLFSALLPFALSLIFMGVTLSANSALGKLYGEYGVQNESAFMVVLKDIENKYLSKKDYESKIESLEATYKLALEKSCLAEEELKGADVWKFSETLEENLKSAKTASFEMAQAKRESEKLFEILTMLKAQLDTYNEDDIRKSASENVDISGIDASNLASKRQEYEFTSKAAEALEVRIHELEKSLAALYPQADNPARIVEKIELAKSFIAEYRKKHAAYLLAYQKIEEAGTSMRESISPKLADFTSKIMSDLTGGKYSEIGINSDLKVTVRTENGMKELEYLSAGTQDIVYVSLRLALINTLFRKSMPCVVFDESFSRLDNTRLSQILKLLKLTGKSMQCILLTSNSREASLMDVSANYSHIKLENK